MGHYTRLFAVIDNGTEVFRGTAKEISEAFDTIASKDQIYTYERTGHRLYGRYLFKDVGKRWVTNVKDPPKKKKTPKHDRELEYLATHLRIYGNVFFHKRADNYKKELEDLGIQFKTRKCVMFKDGFILERI